MEQQDRRHVAELWLVQEPPLQRHGVVDVHRAVNVATLVLEVVPAIDDVVLRHSVSELAVQQVFELQQSSRAGEPQRAQSPLSNTHRHAPCPRK